MKKEQLNIFATSRMQMNESIELTVQSLNAYGEKYNHWAIAWSGGKDSSTLVTLVIWLIETGRVKKPKSLTVIYADTRMELMPLYIAARDISDEIKEHGYDVIESVAPMDDRFMVYILGRGVPPPSNTFRWCTGQIKVEPMEATLHKLHADKREKILMLTGVRQGESAVRDERIVMSCSKDGAECGQGWFQTSLPEALCDTLAPILHWRVCHVWEWLKHWAPQLQYGDWSTAVIADAYGGDEAEEINARTGCVGCPLASKDKALSTVLKNHNWIYLSPLMKLKNIYREMKRPQHRLRKPGGERRKDGKFSKNQQRLGPLTLDARLMFLDAILCVQDEVNAMAAVQGRPRIDLINVTEESRIRELIALNTWPEGWTGEEPTGDVILPKVYNDGSTMEDLFGR